MHRFVLAAALPLMLMPRLAQAQYPGGRPPGLGLYQEGVDPGAGMGSYAYGQPNGIGPSQAGAPVIDAPQDEPASPSLGADPFGGSGSYGQPDDDSQPPLEGSP